MKINFGYCCISKLYKDIRCNTASTKTYLEKHTKEQCKEMLCKKADNNLYNLAVLLQKNYENDIFAFRLPEQILPQIDLGYYSLDDYRHKLKSIGQIANKYNIQLSTHPSQYFVLNSLREDVVEKSINILDIYAETFAFMQLEKVANMTLHIGVKSQYEKTEDALDAFCFNYEKLSENAKKILVIENDQNSFTVDDCLYIHNKIGIPCVFDNRHFHWNKGNFDYNEAVRKCTETWGKRIPKLHLSSENEKTIHAHSDFIDTKDYFEMYDALKKCKREEFNIMLECKEKDAAVMKLREKISLI